MKPWRDRQARERARGEAQRKCEVLITAGKWRARAATRGWDRREAERAQRTCERELIEEIEADWTHANVDELVDEVLGERED